MKIYMTARALSSTFSVSTGNVRIKLYVNNVSDTVAIGKLLLPACVRNSRRHKKRPIT